MNATLTQTVTPTLAIPRDSIDALKKQMGETRSYYGDCIIQLASPDAHPEDHDAETFGLWMFQLGWAGSILTDERRGGNPKYFSANMASEDGYNGVAISALRTVFADNAAMLADAYGFGVGWENRRDETHLRTFSERRSALDAAARGLALWEKFETEANGMDDHDRMLLTPEAS